MTTATRFQTINNTKNPPAPLTAADLPSGDGSDRSVRVVRRNIVAADVGNGAGQTQNATGCIVCTVPAGINILAIRGATYDLANAGPPAEYRLRDNMLYAAGPNGADIRYFFNAADNTIRVHDNAVTNQVQMAANDIVIVEIHSGPTA
jgi:hypothetical protein